MTDGQWPVLFRPVLQKLVADGPQYFGAGAIVVEPVRQLNRPFSTLLQVRVASSGGSQGAFIKILKPRADTPAQIASMRQNVRTDFEMTSRVRAALASRTDLTAVRPIACFPEDMAIVTSEAAGPTLSSVLETRAAGWPRSATVRELSRVVSLVGAWLRAAQAALPQTKHVDVQALRAYLDKRFDDLERTGTPRLTPSGRRQLEAYRDALLASVAPEFLAAVWIHADFCPDNIITHDGRVTVLDFLMAKTGTLYHDVAHLYMHIGAMAMKPWFRPRVIRHLQQQLLGAFEPGLTADRPLFALMLLQHVVCRLATAPDQSAGRASRLYGSYRRRQHRRWLAEMSGLDARSWTR
jgi:hypothetical protein